jgi:hypothetical protein
MPGEGTFLAATLLSALANQRGTGDAAMLVLSDGHDTQDADLQPVASLARSRSIPIHTVVFGAENQQTDLALLTFPQQDYLLPGEAGSIRVKAYQFGLPQASTVLHMRHADQHQELPISFDGRAVVEVQLEVLQQQPGYYEYVIELDAVPGEAEQQNNRQTVFCQVQPRRINVLMLEGQPYWDTKFLAQSLRKDERIELTQITQISAKNRETLVSRASQPSPRVPVTAEQWSRYDVVIVGNELQKIMDQRLASQLCDYVIEQGGHVVFSCGRCYDPAEDGAERLAAALSRIEPVVWADDVSRGDVVQLVAGSLEASWLAPDKMGANPRDAIGKLPGLEAVRSVRRLKPATRVIAETSGTGADAAVHPAIVTMTAGRGQVVALLGHDAWRWSLRPPTDESLLGFYDTFWSNLVRWLVMGGDFQPGQQVSLKLGRQSLQRSGKVDVEVVFKDAAIAKPAWQVVWHDPAGRTRELSLRRAPGRAPRFRTTVVPEVVGIHEFELLSPAAVPERQSQKLHVFDVNLERLETSARPARLQALSAGCGGRFLDVDAPGELLKIIDRHQLSRQIPPELHYVWDKPAILVVLLTWIGCEWLLRRLAGLL